MLEEMQRVEKHCAIGERQGLCVREFVCEKLLACTHQLDFMEVVLLLYLIE